MAITTLDGALAGALPPQELIKLGAGTMVVGRPYSTAYAGGLPGVMTAPSPGIQGIALTTFAGQIPFTNPVSGNTYIHRAQFESTLAGTVLICDRLWHNSGNSATSTSAQSHGLAISVISIANPTTVTCAAHGQAAGTFTVVITGSNSTPSINGTHTATYVSATTFTIPVNVTGSGTTGNVYIGLPPRDSNGTVNGDDVLIGYEVSGLMGAGTPTLTANYTNQAGTSGKTTPSITLTTAYPLGTLIMLPLAAGDLGVRALESHTKNATQTSGTYHMVLFRVLARVPCPAPGVGGVIDAITGGFPRVWDNTVPWLVWVPGNTTAPTITGQIIWAQG